jgi:hypothetical protein
MKRACGDFVTGPFSCRGEKLSLDCIADVFHGFANFPFGGAEAFLDIATGSICITLCFEVAIIQGLADILFDGSFGLVKFSFQLVSVW